MRGGSRTAETVTVVLEPPLVGITLVYILLYKEQYQQLSKGQMHNFHIFVKGAVTIIGHGQTKWLQQTDKINKNLAFMKCASFTNCTTETKNIQIDNSKSIAIWMLMSN